MDPTETKIARFLQDSGLLDRFQYQSALDHQARYGGKFHLVVVELGLVPEERMVTVISKVVGLQAVRLDGASTDPEALKALPASFCEQHHVFPYRLAGGGATLELAMADPTDAAVRGRAQVQSGRKILPVVAAPSDIRQALLRSYGPKQRREVEYAAGAAAGVIDLRSTGDESGEQQSAHLDRLLQGQEQLERIIQGVIDLCTQKGLFSAADLQQRIEKK